MDEIIHRPIWKHKVVIFTLVAIGALVIIYSSMNLIIGTKVIIQGDIEFAKAQLSALSNEIQLRGTVTPRNSVFIDTVVDGRVEGVFAEEGDEVSEGQEILRLTNTNLQLEIISREAQVSEQINNLRNTRLAMEQQSLELQRERIEVEYKLTKLNREVDGFSKLSETGAVAKDIQKNAKEELEYYKKRYELIKLLQESNKKMRAQQIEQLQSNVDQLTRNLEVARQILDNLKIRSSTQGLLSALDTKVGEYVSVGARIGRIDVGDDYQIIALVDEYYLPQVSEELIAEANFANQSIALKVEKIYSQVEAGKFRVDLNFTSPLPPGLRRGQTITLKLNLENNRLALLLPRRGYLAYSRPEWLYVVDESKKNAARRKVHYGESNSQFLELLDGIEEGDLVLLNGYPEHEDRDSISISALHTFEK